MNPCSGAASDTGPAPSLSACVLCGRHPRADLSLVFQEHLWTLGRALCAEQAQPHSPDGRELSPGLYPEYTHSRLLFKGLGSISGSYFCGHSLRSSADTHDRLQNRVQTWEKQYPEF